MSEGPQGSVSGKGCRVGKVSPEELEVATFPLSSCGFNVAANGSSLFLEVATPDIKADLYIVRIEEFSMTSGESQMLPAVSARLFLGSDIAHTQLAFADGALWLYLEGQPARVLELSPSTGGVVRVFRPVSPVGGAEPLITASHGYVWLAGGAGSGADFERIDAADGTSQTYDLGGGYSSVYDIFAVGGRVYFLYLAPVTRAEGSKERQTTAQPVQLGSFVGELSSQGRLVKASREEEVGGMLADVRGQLVSAGPGSACTGPEMVWRINAKTLATTVFTTLGVPGDSCLNEAGPREVATAGSALFVLYAGGSGATSLYRAALAST
ncbi:MAG TPA: hypothetical protein VL984_01515 [Acidimicrobiales bacterium]|nr:hypothetical protein [Acidimicrobiales bacterium]